MFVHRGPVHVSLLLTCGICVEFKLNPFKLNYTCAVYHLVEMLGLIYDYFLNLPIVFKQVDAVNIYG